MSFSKRPDSDAVCYTKPLDSLKRWNDHFFWVDSFACPASFPWHTGKNVSRDPFPKSTKFSADDYVVLVAHPAPFRKFPEPFLCLIGMSRNYTLDEDTYPTFLHDDGTVVDPTKVKVGERERAEEEARLLDSTVAAGGGQEIETEIVTGIGFIADENVVTEKPKRPRKKRQVVTDASGSSHPPKKLSWLRKQQCWWMEVGVYGTMADLAMEFTSLVSATPEHESGVPADSIIGLNLHTIGASERYDAVPLVMTEAVITTNVASIPSAPAPETGTKVISPVHASMFHDSDSTGTNVSNDSLLDDHDASWEFIDHLAPPVLFAQIRKMDYHHLFMDFNVGTARQSCLNAKVRMRTEYCLSERRRLESECEKQVDLLKARVAEVESLKAQLLLKETEAAEARPIILLGSAEDSCPSVSAKDLELKDLNAAVSSLRSQKDGLVDQVLCVTPPKSQQHNGIPLGMGCRTGFDHEASAEVEFPLLAELKSHKDASTADVMNLVSLEGPLADAPGMSDLQPDVEQWTLPIHRPEDQVVLGKASTSGSVPAAVVTTTALSTTFAAASSVPPITIEDYEIVGTDGSKDA
ncbi:hypothetical protein Tco_1316936 [Tanacetum coccineum]